MATMQRRLVHKQFNSPINLYSQRNIQETLDRELKQLSNGAIGIDFDDPSTTKPQSLAKSAVLQALEEEEREQSRAGKGLKRVAWPPPAELGDDYQHQQPAQQQQQQPYHYPPQQQQQPAQFYPQQQQQQQQQHYQQPHTQQQQHQPRERIIPIQRPEPSTQQPQYQPQPTQAFQPLVSQQQQLQQHYQQPEAIPQQQQQQQQFYQQQAPPPAVVADSQLPFFTTLRKEAPMSQEPTPVYHTEPVAAIYQGGTNMRGDQKWPPADVKKQSELDNEERLKLAQQPAFRPRKVQKDYSDFFAKNALNATYPGYRAPPGTQHHS